MSSSERVHAAMSQRDDICVGFLYFLSHGGAVMNSMLDMQALSASCELIWSGMNAASGHMILYPRHTSVTPLVAPTDYKKLSANQVRDLSD